MNTRVKRLSLLLLATGALLAIAVWVIEQTIMQRPGGGMVSIPGGEFLMGCAPRDDFSCDPDQLPQRRVALDPFYLDVHEVTVREYAACVAAGACSEPHVEIAAGAEDKWHRYDFAFNWGKAGRSDHPVNGVSWYDARDYCRWRGKRLPTEAEFEKALRGGLEGKLFPWGDDGVPPPRYGNYQDLSAQREFPFWRIFKDYDDDYLGTAPVCTYPKNPFGLCDISGNVTEWCEDAYAADWYSRMPETNPINEENTNRRVDRGGGWRGTPRSTTSFFRIGLAPEEFLSGRGFRCARSYWIHP